MRKFSFITLLALLLCTQAVKADSLEPSPNQSHPASPGTSHWIIPHFSELPGTSVDLTLNATYTASLAGMPAGIGVVTLDLYLFDQATNLPLQSATNLDICNPCEFTLTTSARTVTFRVEDQILAQGGFSSSGVNGINGFGIIIITGDTDAVTLQVTQKQMQASFDLPLALNVNGPQINPDFIESPGIGTDVLVYSTYVGGLAGIAGAGGANLDLYLYDKSTGAPLKSATNLDICNPCEFTLSAAARTVTFRVEDKILAQGGFPSNPVHGFGIFVISGSDPANVSMQVVQRLPFAYYFLPLIAK